jgi:hypothetical protein
MLSRARESGAEIVHKRFKRSLGQNVTHQGVILTEKIEVVIQTRASASAISEYWWSCRFEKLL